MCRFCLAALLCASTAMAVTVSRTVEYRQPDRGILGMYISASSAFPVITFRDSPDSVYQVRGVVSQIDKPAEGDRVGSVEILVLDSQGNEIGPGELRPSSSSDGGIPTCALDVLVPPAMEFAVRCDQGDMTFDGLRVVPSVDLFKGTVRLLNHGASANVTAGSIVCTIRDPGPADSVSLRARQGNIEVYYPDKLNAAVEAQTSGSVSVNGRGLGHAFGSWGPEKHTLELNPGTETSARLLHLVGAGDIAIQPLSAFGVVEKQGH